jgi:hypothetical protein
MVNRLRLHLRFKILFNLCGNLPADLSKACPGFLSGFKLLLYTLLNP